MASTHLIKRNLHSIQVRLLLVLFRDIGCQWWSPPGRLHVAGVRVERKVEEDKVVKYNQNYIFSA
jgi:hypothetical protein